MKNDVVDDSAGDRNDIERITVTITTEVNLRRNKGTNLKNMSILDT